MVRAGAPKQQGGVDAPFWPSASASTVTAAAAPASTVTAAAALDVDASCVVLGFSIFFVLDPPDPTLRDSPPLF